MEIEKTKLQGCLLFKPKIFHDDRGFFLQTYQRQVYEESGIPYDFVQDNQSLSKKNVLRGLHLQKGKYAQGKLVSVSFGHVLDVAVDLRENSHTFGQWVSYHLSAENGHQLYIPRGFAHGFMALSDQVVLSYKCDNYYHQASECSIQAYDRDLNINWGIDLKDAIISHKDLAGSITFKEFTNGKYYLP